MATVSRGARNLVGDGAEVGFGFGVGLEWQKEMSEASKKRVILLYIVLRFRRWRIGEKVLLCLLYVGIAGYYSS